MKSLIDKLDSGNMAGFTRSFVDDFETALNSEIEIGEDNDWSGVLCIGMGGSGAGGDFLGSLADSEGGLNHHHPYQSNDPLSRKSRTSSTCPAGYALAL